MKTIIINLTSVMLTPLLSTAQEFLQFDALVLQAQQEELLRVVL